MSKKHARTTISLPPDLKDRMDAVEEPINWSAVAAQAFERKLAEIIKKRGPRSMLDVVNRLRSSANEAKSESYREGFHAGRRWAERIADAAQLRRISNFRSNQGDDEWDLCFEDDPASGHSAAEQFFFVLAPENEQTREHSDEFWGSIPRGDVEQDGEYVKGFAEGALDIWHQVEHLL